MSASLPFSASSSQNWVSRLRGIWTDLRLAQAMAAEFAALNALSDADLARMGLTRAVLKRHLHQKHSARVLSGPMGGWHDGSEDHIARLR